MSVQLYKLTFYKQNGSFTREGDSATPSFLGGDDAATSLPGVRAMGYFDFVGGESTSTKQMFNKSMPKTSNNGYISYPVYLFGGNESECRGGEKGFGEGGALGHLLRASDQPGMVTLMTSLQIHERLYSSKKASCYKSGMDMLSSIQRKLEKVLDRSGLSFSIWKTLGSFDLLLLCAAPKISSLSKVLQDMYYNFRAGDTPLVDYATSLFLLPQVDDDNSSDDIISILARIGIYHSTLRPSDIREILIQEYGAKDLEVMLMSGDDDIGFTGKFPFRLLCKFLRDPVPKGLYVRSLQISVCVDDERESPMLSFTSNIEPQPITILKQHHTRAHRLHCSLQKGLDDIAKYLPDATILSFGNLIDTCTHMVGSDYSHLRGMRIGNLLEKAIGESVKDGRFRKDAVHAFLADLAYYAFNTSNIDNVMLDRVETNDAASPIAKMLVSYEEVIMRTAELVDRVFFGDGKVNSKWEVFVTVGRGESLYSQLYFSDIEGMKIFSFNIPNFSYLPLQKAFPLLLHEISHHLQLNKTREFRNKSLLRFLYHYASARLCILLPAHGVEMQYESVKEKTKKLFSDAVEGWNSNGSMMLRDYLYQLCQAIKNGIRCEMSRFNKLVADQQNYDLLTKQEKEDIEIDSAFYEALYSIVEYEFFEKLSRVFREARADSIAMVLGGYDVEFLLNLQYELIMENRFKDIWKDELYLLRMTTVIFFSLCLHNSSDKSEVSLVKLNDWAGKNLEKLRKKRLEGVYSENRLRFHEMIHDYATTHFDLVVPLVLYLLKTLKKNCISQLTLTKENCGLNIQMMINRKDVADQAYFHEEMNFYIDNWYKHMCRVSDLASDKE